MGKKKKSGLFLGIFYGARKKILLSFHILSITSCGIILIIGISHLTGAPSKVQIGLGLLISLAGTVFGAILSVILDLPQIGYYFDEIKNDIALKKIRTPEVFADRLTSLFCDYFAFYFFTVRFCFVKIEGSAYFYSEDTVLKIIEQSTLDEIILTSQKTEDVFYNGSYAFDNKNIHLYLLQCRPITTVQVSTQTAGNLIPPPEGFPVTWDDPEDEKLSWFHDDLHQPHPAKPLEQDVDGDAGVVRILG